MKTTKIAKNMKSLKARRASLASLARTLSPPPEFDLAGIEISEYVEDKQSYKLEGKTREELIEKLREIVRREGFTATFDSMEGYSDDIITGDDDYGDLPF